MIKFEKFEERFQLVELNFNFNYPAKLLALIYQKCQNLSEDDLDESFNSIMRITQEDWNKKFGFGGKPAVADLLIMLGASKKEMSKEELATSEVLKMIDGFTNWQFSRKAVLFDNEITQAALHKYGGAAKLSWDLAKDNEKAKEVVWLKKELKEIWLDCLATDSKSTRPSYFPNSTESVRIIGNQEVGLKMLENNKNQNESQEILIKKILR